MAESETCAGATTEGRGAPPRDLVVEQQWLEPGAQVPLDVVGKHAQQHVCAHPVGGTVIDGSHLQVDGVQTPEGALDCAQAFVGAYRLVGIELTRRDAGAHDIQPIEGRFTGDGLGVASVVERLFGDVELEVLGHLVLADDFPDPAPRCGLRP